MMPKSGYQTYFEVIERTLRSIRETQGDSIAKAATLIREAIAAGGIVHVFGAGHSDILAEEVFCRTGTLVPINHILDVSIAGKIANMKGLRIEKLEGTGPIMYDFARPKAEDVFLIISNAGRNSAQIELAREAQEHAHAVIALTSKDYSLSMSPSHSSGKRLLDYADVVLSNCGDLAGDACIAVPGMTHLVGPTSTVAGAYILNAVMVQAVFELSENGNEPSVFVTGNVKNSKELNEEAMAPYIGRVKNW